MAERRDLMEDGTLFSIHAEHLSDDYNHQFVTLSVSVGQDGRLILQAVDDNPLMQT